MTAQPNAADRYQPVAACDFKSTIERLERRAKGARRRVTWAWASLAVGVVIIAAVIFFGVARREMQTTLPDKFSALFAPSTANVESLLAGRVAGLVRQLSGGLVSYKGAATQATPPTAEEAQRLKVELGEALDYLERAVKIDAQREPDPLSSRLASITWTVIFSAGAVFFLVLLVQISVMFIRYHVRLAEFYDAQADALRAAGGDAQLAFGFLERFSPNMIEMGAAPTTIYEKTLEAIKEVAGRRA